MCVHWAPVVYKTPFLEQQSTHRVTVGCTEVSKMWLVTKRGLEIVVEKRQFRLMISQPWSVTLPQPPGSREPQPNAEAAAAPSLASISQFVQKLVEKLYSGMFSADPRHILLFITEHIMLVRTSGWLWW